MAEQDDLVEVELDEENQDDAGKKGKETEKSGKKDGDEGVEVVEKPAKNGKDASAGQPTADDVAAKLKKDLEKANAGKLAAEKKARDEAAAREAAESEVTTTQMQLVVTAIANLKAESERLEDDYAAAFAANDGKALAKIQRQMATAEAKLLQLENGKQAMEDEAKRAKEQPRRVESNDPVERFASQLTAPSADWVRAHPEFARDPRKNRQMIRAHEDVMDEGYVADTPEYFAAVEKKLGLGSTDETPEVEVVAEAAKPTGGRRAAPAAAPVSHSGGASGGRQTQATLTKEQAEIAEMMGMSKREYYNHLQSLKKEGRIN